MFLRRDSVAYYQVGWELANGLGFDLPLRRTPLYPLFETKIDKPLQKPFVSHVSFWWEEHAWKFNVNVRKVASSGAVPPTPQ